MKLIFFVIFSVSLMTTFAHTEEECLAVAECLVRMIMCSPEWEDNLKIDGTGEEVGVRYQNYDDLFSADYPSNVVGSTWTPAERKTAFENFVAAIPDLSTNGMYRPIATHASVALGFCRDFGVTNALPSAISILSDKEADSRGTIWSAALGVFEEFGTLSDAVNDFAAQILTNKTPQTAMSRKYFLGAYATILAKGRNNCDPMCFTNGIVIVQSGLYGWAGAVAVDKLLLESYPDYAISSNRMALAVSALNAHLPNERHWDWASSIRRYFEPVTNQLMNATQPLPEVEALRGL